MMRAGDKTMGVGKHSNGVWGWVADGATFKVRMRLLQKRVHRFLLSFLTHQIGPI